MRSPLTDGSDLSFHVPSVVTTVDAAALRDLGYRVNMDAAVRTGVLVGAREIFEEVAPEYAHRRAARYGDLHWRYLGVEALLFPENPWDRSPLVSSWWAPWTPYDDPVINWDNVYMAPDVRRSDWEPRGAGKRTLHGAGASVSWCGVGRD